VTYDGGSDQQDLNARASKVTKKLSQEELGKGTTEEVAKMVAECLTKKPDEFLLTQISCKI
jgi:hypothetical protein